MDREIKKLTVHSVLGCLRRETADGMTTTGIALAHDYPVSYHQRSNRVSQIMKVLAAEGSAELAGTERSPLYRHGPVKRWRITPAGIRRYEEGSDTAQRIAASRERAEQMSHLLAEAAQERIRALDQVRGEIEDRVRDGGLGAVTTAWREQKIIELRAVPCSLSEIGRLFGLTRERVRQIEMSAGGRTGTAVRG